MGGRLFRLGLLGLGALVAELVVLVIVSRPMGTGLISMVSVEVFAGREGAIPLGLGGGAPAWLVAQVSATQDLVAVALVYPLFLYAIEKYRGRDNFLMRRVQRIDEAANRHRKVVDRFGGFGLAAFMVVPFLVNGPLVGAVMGRLAGMGPRALIAPVVGATVAAAFAWSYFYKGMQNLFPDFDQAMSFVVSGVIVVLLVGVSALFELRDRRRRRRST
ncbi:MAG TPA: small multi-drug export protein [Candidatus Thermoplasmatota archaeon]|nr:small multi-drug export protein [Candidatus Thermoplasmatota archaeon]